MNYHHKVVGLTGATGFLGGQLYKRLSAAGAYVNVLDGDMRDQKTFEGVDYEYDYIFHFAAPSSEVLFKRQPMFAAEVTIQGFMNAAKAARQAGAKLIYPSTGLLSMASLPETKNKEQLVGTVEALDGNHYARAKKICEDIHLGEGLDALGVRIFATYGPQEGHKRDYASTPYLFATDIEQGRGPVIWGDGEQTRDFIYIDDVVEALAILAEEANEPIIDLGSGEPVSFNNMVQELAYHFEKQSGKKVPEPLFHNRPAGYIQETVADVTVMKKYYRLRFPFSAGIHNLVKGVRENAANHESNRNYHDQPAYRGTEKVRPDLSW